MLALAWNDKSKYFVVGKNPTGMSILLNPRAWDLVDQILNEAGEYRIVCHELPCGARVLDFGVETTGSLAAGIKLAEVCTSGLMEIKLQRSHLGSMGWPYVSVMTDHPVEACLLSQYAGWKIEVGTFRAMGSGPMRAIAASEALFTRLGYRETFYCCVGILETSRLPTSDVVAEIARKTHIEPRNIILLVARTSSLAGNLQIVTRSIETALHKLFELGFDVRKVLSAWGSAPLPPLAGDDLTAIGRTNDAIIYGGEIHLMVSGDDAELAEIVKKVPSSSSDQFGKPFQQIFEDAGQDFYQIDPQLFSPAQIVFQNVETGRVHLGGCVNSEVLMESFGLSWLDSRT